MDPWKAVQENVPGIETTCSVAYSRRVNNVLQSTMVMIPNFRSSFTRYSPCKWLAQPNKFIKVQLVHDASFENIMYVTVPWNASKLILTTIAVTDNFTIIYKAGNSSGRKVEGSCKFGVNLSDHINNVCYSSDSLLLFIHCIFSANNSDILPNLQMDRADMGRVASRKGCELALVHLRNLGTPGDMRIYCNCCPVPMMTHSILFRTISDTVDLLIAHQKDSGSYPYQLDMTMFDGEAVHTLVNYIYQGELRCDESKMHLVLPIVKEFNISTAVVSIARTRLIKFHDDISRLNRIPFSLTLVGPDQSIMTTLKTICTRIPKDVSIMRQDGAIMLGHRELLVAFSDNFDCLLNSSNFGNYFVYANEQIPISVLTYLWDFMYCSDRSYDLTWRTETLHVLKLSGLIRIHT